tara:strand:+ start:241 stop:897 length:657 start_codon:yes stop_codon:yes gene_type:complete
MTEPEIIDTQEFPEISATEGSSSASETEKQIIIVNNLNPSLDGKASRSVGLIGDISEQKSEEVIGTLIHLSDQCDPDAEVIRPIDMYISTYGGSVVDMFAMYDLMRVIKQKCTVSTIGLGKVMSAGVLLLANGTKGERKVGKNCRIMLHNVMAGFGGTLINVENEVKEVKWIQQRYIDCLEMQTNLTKKKIQKMLNKQLDVYISAEQAIEYGIADVII